MKADDLIQKLEKCFYKELQEEIKVKKKLKKWKNVYCCLL